MGTSKTEEMRRPAESQNKMFHTNTAKVGLDICAREHGNDLAASTRLLTEAAGRQTLVSIAYPWRWKGRHILTGRTR